MYIFRWTSKSVYSQAKEFSHANDESYLSPVITVEGRGKGFAVVQMKNTFYITDNNKLQNLIYETGQNNKQQSQASLEAFNLDATVELQEAPKGLPPTRLRVKSCQR